MAATASQRMSGDLAVTRTTIATIIARAATRAAAMRARSLATGQVSHGLPGIRRGGSVKLRHYLAGDGGLVKLGLVALLAAVVPIDRRRSGCRSITGSDSPDERCVPRLWCLYCWCGQCPIV